MNYNHDNVFVTISEEEWENKGKRHFSKYGLGMIHPQTQNKVLTINENNGKRKYLKI